MFYSTEGLSLDDPLRTSCVQNYIWMVKNLDVLNETKKFILRLLYVQYGKNNNTITDRVACKIYCMKNNCNFIQIITENNMADDLWSFVTQLDVDIEIKYKLFIELYEKYTLNLKYVPDNLKSFMFTIPLSFWDSYRLCDATLEISGIL